MQLRIKIRKTIKDINPEKATGPVRFHLKLSNFKQTSLIRTYHNYNII